MKLKDILNMSKYLKEDCYCPGEIYSTDGFFFQVFKENAKCYEIGRCNNYNNGLSKIPFIAVIANSTDNISQLLIIFYDKEKIKDIIRFDATENNIKLIKEIIENGKSDLKFNEYERQDTSTATKQYRTQHRERGKVQTMRHSIRGKAGCATRLCLAIF